MTDSSSKIKNPQISATVQKMQLKKVDQEVNTMRNRVELLRNQLQKQKDQAKKNKQLVKQVISKKIEVNRINQFKQRDSSDEQGKLEQLRKRNRSFRQSHQRQLQNIQKAIYLVKLDDARQLKNVSIQHKRKIKDMERQFLSAQQEKKKKIAEQSSKAKQRYMKYWRQKLQSLYTEQAQTLLDTINEKQSKKKQLKQLEEQQMKLLDEINKAHSVGIQSKKQYLAALSLPVKQVAEAMGQSSLNQSVLNKNVNQSQLINSSRYQKNSTTLDKYEKSGLQSTGLKLPNASVNQAKLKVILSQLKKIDKRADSSSSQS